MVQITIVDESTLGEQYAWGLDVLNETMSLRELIRRRIYQEVTEYNTSLIGYFRGLIWPSEVERTVNRFCIKSRQRLDWLQQYERAIAAFAQRRYIVLVDNQQITDLDTPVTLHAGSRITFFKLIPLVGG